MKKELSFNGTLRFDDQAHTQTTTKGKERERREKRVRIVCERHFTRDDFVAKKTRTWISRREERKRGREEREEGWGRIRN